MEYLFDQAILFGDVFLSDNKKACLLVLYPHQKKILFKTIKSEIKLAFKAIGIFRVFKVLRRQRTVAKNYPKENYLKPLILGVQKEAKGNGTAARFMIEVKSYFKNNKLPVIIDVALEKNVKLYQKFGFRVFNVDDSLGFPIYFLRLN